VTLILTTPAAAVALLFWAWALHRSLRTIAASRTRTDIIRIVAGLHLVEPEPWPARQAESDVAGAYAPIDSPAAQWPWETGYAPALDRHIAYDWDEVVREAVAWNWAVETLGQIYVDVRDRMEVRA
jgi:hypothetical protein